MKKSDLKESIKRQKRDRQRALRVAKYLDYPFVLENSPVELEKGFIVSDRESGDVFASFIFKNLSELPLKKLNIRLLCYLNQNIPYEHIDFTYSQDELTFGIIQKNGEDMKLRDANKRTYVNQNECFGSCVFIPIPESYFTKLEVVLVSAEFSGGRVDVIDTVVAGDNKRYHELDDMSKMAYSRVNIYYAAEEKFPTKVMPQFGQQVWLCCCGNKNAIDSKVCEKCGRDMEWQKTTATADAIEESRNRMIADPNERAFHDKTKFAQNKYLESDADVQKKISQYEKAMEKIALEEKRRERNKMMFLPKMLLWFVVILFVASIFQYIAIGGGIIGGLITIGQIIVDYFKIVFSI